MNENPNVESPGARVPRQVLAQGQHARDILAKAAADEPPPSEVPPPKDAAAAQVPFTYEELLKAPTPEKDASIVYWKARCNVTEGHRRADNENSRKRIERLELELDTLKAKNLELVQAKAATPAPAPAPPIDLRKAMLERFSADEIESFGEDRALTMTRELIKQGASAEAALAELRGRFDALIETQKKSAKTEEQRQQEAALERHRKFLDELTEGFPQWAETNKDQRWLDWLDGVDESSGLVRQKILDAHQGNKDAKNIVRMLEAFVKSLSPTTLPPSPPETPNRVAGTGGDNPPDAKLGSDQPPMTADEMKAGYKAKALGKMTADEAKLFDARVEATMKARGRG